MRRVHKFAGINLALLALCVVFNCQATMASAHKIRHFRHKIVHIDDRHVNEIREAFEDYKKTVKSRGLGSTDSDDDDLTHDASSDYENEIVFEKSSKLQTTRHKRVDAYESTLKSTTETDNYDDEYDDDDVPADTEKTRKAKKSSSGGVKVHVSLLIKFWPFGKLISYPRNLNADCRKEWVRARERSWYVQSKSQFQLTVGRRSILGFRSLTIDNFNRREN